MAQVRSTAALFEAISGRGRTSDPALPFGNLPKQKRPRSDERHPDDFYATSQPEPVRGLLARDEEVIRACGSVWDSACGDGAMVREIRAAGLPCFASDLVDRGCQDAVIANFYTFQESPARAIITNPPYCEINSRDGHGRWLRHTLNMPGWDYLALLLSWDWPAARSNGLGQLLESNPFSYCYLMRWKIDFTGEGAPPQRNAWFIWRRGWNEVPMQMRFMDKRDGDALRQESLF